MDVTAIPSVADDRSLSANPAFAVAFRKAAHDIRTPLAAVTQGIDALLNLTDETPEGAQRLFNLVRRNVVLMGEVLSASIDRTRAMQRPLTEIDLGELVRDVADLIDPVLRARGQTIDVSVSGHATIVGDYGGLARVVLNLLDNASKYGPTGDNLRVRVRRRAAATIVAVHDHGPGIPRGERHAIFRAFYRGNNAKQSQVDGMGLGLSVVREVIDQHRGSVGVTCERGETRVWFCIPTRSTDGESA
jgi:two-component system, OmpR family, phosphate regulon sensor histidine kinase PhoR